MNIGSDCDDTKFEYFRHLCEHLNSICKKKVKYENVYEFNIFEVWKIPEKERNFIHREINKFNHTIHAQNPVLLVGAKETYEGLKKLGHTNYSLTSKHSSLHESTIESHESSFSPGTFEREHIIFSRRTKKWQYSSRRKPKFQIVAEKNIQMFIEDNLEELLLMARSVRYPLLFKQPWNRIAWKHRKPKVIRCPDGNLEKMLVFPHPRGGYDLILIENYIHFKQSPLYVKDKPSPLYEGENLI